MLTTLNMYPDWRPMNGPRTWWRPCVPEGKCCIRMSHVDDPVLGGSFDALIWLQGLHATTDTGLSALMESPRRHDFFLTYRKESKRCKIISSFPPRTLTVVLSWSAEIEKAVFPSQNLEGRLHTVSTYLYPRAQDGRIADPSIPEEPYPCTRWTDTESELFIITVLFVTNEWVSYIVSYTLDSGGRSIVALWWRDAWASTRKSMPGTDTVTDTDEVARVVTNTCWGPKCRK